MELRAPGKKAKKAAGQSRRHAKRDFKNAKKEFKTAMAEAKLIAKESSGKSRRKWPWLMTLAVLGGAVAYAMRPQEEPPVAPAPPRSTDIPDQASATSAKQSPDTQAATGAQSSSPASQTTSSPETGTRSSQPGKPQQR